MQRPTVVLCSPYVRARLTAETILELERHGARCQKPCPCRRAFPEKEFGILDRLTGLGIRHKYPELAEAHRQHRGQILFSPPGGESWCDVILRLRNVIDTITREYRRERVLIVGHQVIVNCFRYLFERMDERQILEIDRMQ